jgi:hypothetical protein
MLSGRRRQAQPRRGRREAPRATTPRAATSRRRHSLARAACLLRVRTSSSASSGKAAAPEPSGGSSASAACPAAAQRCRSRRLTEPLRQLAPRYRRPPPTLGHCRGRAERRARRCGAGSGFYSASGTISPIYGRSKIAEQYLCPGHHSRFGTSPGANDLYQTGGATPPIWAAAAVSCCQHRTAHLAACDICRAAATGRWRGLSRLSPEKLVVQRGLPAVVSAPSRVAAHAARHAAARARSRPSEGLRERPDRGRQEGTRCAPAVCRRWRWSALAG